MAINTVEIRIRAPHFTRYLPAMRSGPFGLVLEKLAIPAPIMSSLRPATLGYIGPFLAFVGSMAIEKALDLPPMWFYPLRFALVLVLILIWSRPYLDLRPSNPVGS